MSKHFNPSVAKQGVVSGLNTIHSFSCSFVKTGSGTLTAAEFGLPYFFVAPLANGALTVHPFNNDADDDITLPAEFVEANIGSFIPIQVTKVEATGDIMIGL